MRWRIAVLVSAAIAISYLDRQTLPVAIKAIEPLALSRRRARLAARNVRRRPEPVRAVMSRRRVVVTGLGIVSPVGIGVADGWANILAGSPASRAITRFDARAFPSRIAGEVKGFDVDEVLSGEGGAPLSTRSSTTAWRRRWRRCSDAGLDDYDRRQASASACASARASAACR